MTSLRLLLSACAVTGRGSTDPTAARSAAATLSARGELMDLETFLRWANTAANYATVGLVVWHIRRTSPKKKDEDK